MPQIFKIGSYIIYFWVNENDPLEPVHIHVTQGKPSPYATKIWITRAGGCLLQHNHSLIPDRQLRIIMQIAAAAPRRDRAQMAGYLWQNQILLL